MTSAICGRPTAGDVADLPPYVLFGDGDARAAQLLEHRSQPAFSALQDPSQLLGQGRIARIEQVAEQMDTSSGVLGRDLHARDEGDGVVCCGLGGFGRFGSFGGFGPSGDGVMVGECEDVQTGGGSEADDLGRPIGTVRRRRVGVQVDTHAATLEPGRNLDEQTRRQLREREHGQLGAQTPGRRRSSGATGRRRCPHPGVRRPTASVRPPPRRTPPGHGSRRPSRAGSNDPGEEADVRRHPRRHRASGNGWGDLRTVRLSRRLPLRRRARLRWGPRTGRCPPSRTPYPKRRHRNPAVDETGESPSGGRGHGAQSGVGNA